MKKVKEEMKTKGASEESIKEFESGAGAFAKKIVGSFKDYEFFIGESMDPDGMYVTTRSNPRVTLFVNLFQGRSSQLPRGWCHSLCHGLEARSHRDEGLSLGI
jgi:hypothetical protein